MSALNSLPLPVVRLLAFFHEELSERRPGRVPQTVQLWVGCLLVILISMTLRSLCGVIAGSAVLRYSVERVLHQICGDLVCGCHGAGDRQPVLIYKWSYGEPLIRLIIAGPILMGCMF